MVHLSEDKNDGLIYDLEVSPLRGYFYSRWQTNALWVDQEQYLMSFAYKWASEKEIHYLDLRDTATFLLDPTADRELVRALFELWQHSGWVMGYNGDRFDNKMAKTFFVRNGFVCNKKMSIDPLKIVKKEFRFSANSMKNVAIELGVEEKMEVSLGNITRRIIEHRRS